MVKLGLDDSYDKTVINKKIRAAGDLTKPASSIGVMLTIPFSAIIFGELYHTSGVWFVLQNWETVIFASVTMFLLHGASQAMNMAEDAEMDRLTDHKQNRPIPAGILSEEGARSLAWIFMFLGVTRAFTITPEFGAYAVILAFFGIFYNLKPVRAKKRLWFNLGWQAASRGLLLYPASFAIWGEALNPVAWGMGVVAFLLVLAMQNTADFSDVEIDERFDIITPAVAHGLNELVKIMAGIVTVMFLLIFLFIKQGIIPNLWSLYLLVIPIGWSLQHLRRYPGNISELGGNSPTWYVFYGCLASLYILPAIQLVLL